MYIADEPDGSYRAVDTRLVGIATFQRDATHMCQAMERIEQCLVPAIASTRAPYLGSRSLLIAYDYIL
jgi:hypothetical protein